MDKSIREKIIRAALVIVIMNLCSCDKELPKIQNPFENKDGNLILYVSNQSYETKIVDILVTIDDTPTLHEYFKVANQHLWKQFSLQLSQGRHKIKAVTWKGNAVIEQEFELNGKRWAVLNFCYGKQEGHMCNKPSFLFEVFDKPIRFL